ncbi:UDP-N-acetylmuramoyl-tripeptide--D-alanyl-D-alanine ligase [Acidovorax lacteus]|uniref:UDP-N-acetylmuramoyl-tripeptide--D-alanyl-D-alanine ligase n=2 Tax=Acidovorax lacteus TaxID=1924988 RepID=A0ABP8KYI6_9BURK
MTAAMMTLGQAHAWIAQRIPPAQCVGEPSTPLLRVHTDTRSLQAGDLFVALRGERFDAHDFLAQAAAAGAVAAVAEPGRLPPGLPGIVVPDTGRALGALAAGWRAQFPLPLVAVTGSNGKTTVTQMIAAILAAHAGERAFSTRGNLNNAVGVPQTLLRLTPAHRIGVVELGMNHPGEIADLAAIAQPTVALVNNAQREHLEFMQTVEAVARENGSVLRALPPDGVAVFPADDPYTPLWQSLAGQREVVTFGEGAAVGLSHAAVWADGAWQVSLRTPTGTIATSLAIAGRHNVRNALAAAACALAAGVPLEAIARGLSAFQPVQGRSRALSLAVQGHVLSVVDDTYNANPDSVRAAIDVLAELPGPRLLVLGDMGEVGDQGPAFHREVGAYARERGIEHLHCLGSLSVHAAHAFGAGAQHWPDMHALQQAVLQRLTGVGSVLVKGSRFMRMEQAIHAIEAAARPGDHHQQEGTHHATH